MNFAPWRWAQLLLGGLVVGLSKTGVAGLGILAVGLLANVKPARRQPRGVVLPLLILGGIFGVLLYRRPVERQPLVRLFLWAVAGTGLLAGFKTLGANAVFSVPQLVFETSALLLTEITALEIPLI